MFRSKKKIDDAPRLLSRSIHLSTSSSIFVILNFTIVYLMHRFLHKPPKVSPRNITFAANFRLTVFYTVQKQRLSER